MEFSCIVLAGGRGLRLGSNKALEVLGGKTLIRRAVENLRSLRSEIIVVTGSRADDLGLRRTKHLRFVPDDYPGRGPLAGIYSGLKASNTPLNIVVACDMPFLNLRLLRYMVGQADGAGAVVPRIGSLIEPLHAVYARNCLGAIESLFARGAFAVSQLLEAVSVRYVEEAEIDRFDPGHLSFFNINTAGDLAKARELLGN